MFIKLAISLDSYRALAGHGSGYSYAAPWCLTGE